MLSIANHQLTHHQNVQMRSADSANVHALVARSDLTLPSQCRSSNSTSFAASLNTDSQGFSIQSAAHVPSVTTYMVVFQDSVSAAKIEQLCSTADSNYGFKCAQTFSKTFKGFSATVSVSAYCACHTGDFSVCYRPLQGPYKLLQLHHLACCQTRSAMHITRLQPCPNDLCRRRPVCCGLNSQSECVLQLQRQRYVNS